MDCPECMCPLQRTASRKVCRGTLSQEFICKPCGKTYTLHSNWIGLNDSVFVHGSLANSPPPEPDDEETAYWKQRIADGQPAEYQEIPAAFLKSFRD